MTHEKLIKKYGTLPLSPRLAAMVMRLPPKASAALMQRIINFKYQAREAIKQGDTQQQVLAEFYRASEELAAPSPEISCRKGCAHCCHIQVTITPAEAEIIKLFCAENNIEIDYNYLQKQMGLQEDTHARSAYAACVFLKDNVCSIYDVRPFNCRNYHVASPPQLCDAKKYPKQQVKVFVDVNREILQSGFIAALPQEQDSIARTFTKKK